MNNNSPIGVFDSGLGGISVLNKCVNMMPNEDFIYFADKKNAPYGDKDREEIISLVIDVMDNIFIPNKVKAVVIACNTATNAAIDILRDKYAIDIVGTEPAIKPALEDCSSDKKVVVLATESTINSERFKSKLKALNPDKCIPIGCSGLVELIEADREKEIQGYLKAKFNNLTLPKIHSVVLGCTHYPFIKDSIEDILGDNVGFFDGGDGVARRLKYLLCEKDISCKERKIGNVKIMNSLDENYNEYLHRYLWR